MSQTQERLANGKRVNSAIDNASAYYTAQSLSNRASDLSALMDSMGQAISTIKAANEGIESVTSFVEQAKAVATSAVDTTDSESRKSYAKQFNSIIEQLDKLAADSGYKGINLLQGNDLTVIFNEARDNKLDIKGVDVTAHDLGLDAQDWDVEANETVIEKKAAIKTAQDAYDAVKADGVATTEFTANANIDNTGKVTAAIAGGTKVLYGGKYYVVKDGGAAADDTFTEKATEWHLSGDGKVYETAEKAGKYAAIAAAETQYNTAVDNAKKAITTAINGVIENATKAINTLRSYASDFGTNYSIVQNRQSFTENLINVLEEGADNLVLADMNEESANMLALQTRQQLAINSLSLASQAAQSVLKLF
jgi:flagellin-like hook-associated protein FlgL